MEQTKRCTKCGETLPIADFHKDKSKFLGVRGECKQCHAKAKQLRLQTPKGAKARRKSVKRYNQTDKRKAVLATYQLRRKEMQALATPPWAPLHLIASIYAEAERLTVESGVKHEVHHIMPIMEFEGLFVGLHVPWNLEILTVEEHTAAHVELRREYARVAANAKKK
jgi:5-methylcytosine-specific restriction endonuclease McrA